MNGLPYYKRYPRDFLDGTVGMPFEAKGAYAIILDLIYQHGGNLPDDPRYISGQLGCGVRAWKKHRQTLLDWRKIQVENEFISNFRAIFELETTAKYQRKQSENRRGPNKNKDLKSPPSNHTDTDTDTVKGDTNVSPKKVPTKRGTRLPEDWKLPKDWGDWALSQGWPESVVRLEAEKFKDWWIAKSGQNAAKMDWEATWRNWMRNSKSPKVINGEDHDRPASKSARQIRAWTQGARGS